jgi:acetyl-CoA carboxylase, biotin carboxylase subunit
MYSRILIANRGEIALRVIRACRELGIETVVVYSEADRGALYLRQADTTVCIGPGPAGKSYLDISRIVSAAEITDVGAIHPGYGFLSENSHFAEICRSCNIDFIGPDPEVMRKVGDKVQARALARQAGLPLLPGSEGVVKDDQEAVAIAHRIGYPIMIKASGGGGGRGMRVAHTDVSLVNGFLAAQVEAKAAFKNADLYIEKYLERPRHVEIQIMADRHGSVVHLGERDCTLQRRHQKIVEESPSPVLTPHLRREIGEAAVAFARKAGYNSVGTIEFLLAPDGKYYFMEMNARVQVEHPVTEMVTGIDIVKEQIRASAGERLPVTQRDVKFAGSAIECRINAEDPADNFRPSPGRITAFCAPGGPGVRIDSHCYAGYEVSPFYDSLIAKLIVHRRTRQEAIVSMRRALDEFVVEGVKTNIPLHRRIFADRQFIRGDVDTTFVENAFGK